MCVQPKINWSVVTELSHGCDTTWKWGCANAEETLCQVSLKSSGRRCWSNTVLLLSLWRGAEHAQHRHPVVSDTELGLRRQYSEIKEQAERASNQLYPVLSSSPGNYPAPTWVTAMNRGTVMLTWWKQHRGLTCRRCVLLFFDIKIFAIV